MKIEWYTIWVIFFRNTLLAKETIIDFQLPNTFSNEKYIPANIHKNILHLTIKCIC